MTDTRLVGIRDVARKAGVSITTVSRVLSDSELVKPGTRERVLSAVEELNYVVNGHARALVSGGGSLVAFLVDEVVGPSFAQLAGAAEEVATEYGKLFMLCTTHTDPGREKRFIDLMSEQRAAAVLLVGAVQIDPGYEDRIAEFARKLGSVGTQLILCGRPPVRSAPQVTSVEYDNVGGGYAVTRHLTQLGHERIMFVGAPAGHSTADARLSGYREAMTQAGLTVTPDLTPEADFSLEDGQRVVTEAIENGVEFTAIVAAADHIAVGCLRALRAAGRRVPDDVSLTGFDDIPMVADLTPALTTVRIPFEELGRVTTRLALNQAERDAYRHVVLPTELVVRDSTAPPAS